MRYSSFHPIAITFLLLLAFPATSMASDLPERLEAALIDLEARKQPGLRLSFLRTTYRHGEKSEVKQFDAALPVPQRWRVVFPSAADDRRRHAELSREYAKSDGGSDLAVMLGDIRARIGENVSSLRTAEDAEVFGFDFGDDYFLEGGGMTAEISDKLKGEIAIDTNTNTIRWIRYYAPKVFHPIAIVRLNRYEIIQHVAPAWDGGPLVRVYETSKANGSAVIKRINVDEIMINENFSKVEVAG
jgi:hypothetical protein